MELLLIVGLLVLNAGISWWNAKVCGQAWAETKALGGFMRLVVWSGAIQSAIGFSMVYVFVIGGLGAWTGYIPAKAFVAMTQLWYIAVIVPALGTGIIITVHSWIVAYRERDLTSMGMAAWNTFSTGYNIYNASSGIGDAVSKLGDFFGSEEDDALKRLVIMVVVFALLAGVLTTATLIKKYEGTLPLPEREPEQAYA